MSKIETKRRRFNFGDREGIYTLSLGNPGALTVIAAIMQRRPDVEAMLVLLALDDMNLRGSQVWVAYKDACGSDLDALIDRVQRRAPALVEAVNRIIPDGERAVTGGASFAHLDGRPSPVDRQAAE